MEDAPPFNPGHFSPFLSDYSSFCESGSRPTGGGRRAGALPGSRPIQAVVSEVVGRPGCCPGPGRYRRWSVRWPAGRGAARVLPDTGGGQ